MSPPAGWSPLVEAFLDRPLLAVLATHAPNGAISQSVVWFAREGQTVWVSCRPHSAKARHVRRDPRVSLLALAPHGGSYVRVEGNATLDEIVTPERRLTLVTPYEGADAALWIAQNPLPSPNALLRLHPERVVSRGL